MVAETLDLAQKFSAKKWPILATLDTHEADKPEPPYPPHCIRGTGEELLVDELKWLERDESATLMEKDCINAFVGGMTNDGSNVIIDWVQKNDLELILTVGICTDICVMDFVLTALSARNHGLLGSTLKTIAVYTAGCSTYSLPRRVAESLGFGPQSAHPQTPTHHMGLYFMHSRGALLVDSVTIDEED